MNNDKRKSRTSAYRRDTITLPKPPSAREAAFGGPPRYDWIDIETAAAIKIQSVYRRNNTMKQLEQEGRTTAAIRNRIRRRKARIMQSKSKSGGADVPSIFACCGVGLAFGEATEENYYYTRQNQKLQYEEEKKQAEAKDEQLRRHYGKSLKTKVQAGSIEEAYEILE